MINLHNKEIQKLFDSYLTNGKKLTKYKTHLALEYKLMPQYIKILKKTLGYVIPCNVHAKEYVKTRKYTNSGYLQLFS